MWIIPSFVFVSGILSGRATMDAKHYGGILKLAMTYAWNQFLLVGAVMLVPQFQHVQLACVNFSALGEI